MEIVTNPCLPSYCPRAVPHILRTFHDCRVYSEGHLKKFGKILRIAMIHTIEWQPIQGLNDEISLDVCRRFDFLTFSWYMYPPDSNAPPLLRAAAVCATTSTALLFGGTTDQRQTNGVVMAFSVGQGTSASRTQKSPIYPVYAPSNSTLTLYSPHHCNPRQDDISWRNAS